MFSCQELRPRLARCAQILTEVERANPAKVAPDVIEALKARLRDAQTFLNLAAAESPREAVRRDVLVKLCELIEVEFAERDPVECSKANGATGNG